MTLDSPGAPVPKHPPCVIDGHAGRSIRIYGEDWALCRYHDPYADPPHTPQWYGRPAGGLISEKPSLNFQHRADEMERQEERRR